MAEPRVVRLTLENLSTLTKSFSLEPYGDYSNLPPGTTVHATWELSASGDLELEITVTNDGVIVGDASLMAGLRPSRDEPGGQLWGDRRSRFSVRSFATRVS